MTAPPLANLINELTKLPGVGGKSAARLAYHILKRPAAEAEALATAILDVKAKIFRCSVCNNMTDVEPCAICADARRDPSVIAVVEEAFNIQTIEQTRDFKGVYHVLLGALSPLKGIGPQDIDVAGLLKRVQKENPREIIIATNPNVEGEATALYIAQQLRPLNVRTTRLAFGLPVGGDLEYADQVTMSKALEGRREISPGRAGTAGSVGCCALRHAQSGDSAASASGGAARLTLFHAQTRDGPTVLYSCVPFPGQMLRMVNNGVS